jgi:RHH-type transcriptional regulator, rel operon repressor / antitoxin RelB
MSNAKSTTSVRLSSTNAKRLDRLSKVIERPKSQLINKALEEYLTEYEDYLLAIERLNDKNDKIVSEKEMRKKLGL